MASNVFSSIGTTIGVSAVFSTATGLTIIDAATFGALTYQPIGDVSDIGTFGNESAVQNFNPIGEDTTYKIKTTKDAGGLDLKGAYAPTDVGQAQLITNEASPLKCAVKITLQNGTIYYAQVLVASYKTNVGTSSSFTMFEAKLPISGKMVKV